MGLRDARFVEVWRSIPFFVCVFRGTGKTHPESRPRHWSPLTSRPSPQPQSSASEGGACVRLSWETRLLHTWRAGGLLRSRVKQQKSGSLFPAYQELPGRASMAFHIAAGICSSCRGRESLPGLHKSISGNVLLRGCTHRTGAFRESVELAGGLRCP